MDNQVAGDAIKRTDTALNKVTEIRSRIGAYQNRLEHTIDNIDNTAENLQAAESRIRDNDMARAMVEYAKDSILMQTAQSVLAQSSKNPQQILQLLR